MIAQRGAEELGRAEGLFGAVRWCPSMQQSQVSTQSVLDKVPSLAPLTALG